MTTRGWRDPAVWRGRVLRLAASSRRLNPALRHLGLELRALGPPHERDPTIDFPPEWQETIRAVEPYTMVAAARTGALIQAVEHVVAAGVPGAVVECGVWRGGSSMAAAITLQRLGEQRDLYLFDTFEGMPAPSSPDVDYCGRPALDIWDPANRGARASMRDVHDAMAATGYPQDRVILVKGRVEETIPAEAPTEIAILRLDTDWYESTRHELLHLYPRLSSGGVLIVDDYGHYAGSRRAVDEYVPRHTFLHRLDYTGRLIIKP